MYKATGWTVDVERDKDPKDPGYTFTFSQRARGQFEQ
jgi:hypothetical protein